MIYLHDPMTTHLFLYNQINHECTHIPKAVQKMYSEIVSLEFCLSQIVGNYLVTEGSSSPYLGSCSREENIHSQPAITYSKALTKYWTGEYLLCSH